jgi:hypothetical protein
MKAVLLLISVMLCVALVFPIEGADLEIRAILQAATAPEWFVVEGLVEHGLNVTYAELSDLPLVSEVATLMCVGSGNGGPSITYNWTGVPLFYLLSMAGIVSGAYRKVVFNATDGFSSSIPLEIAMQPTSILAFEANGTDLEKLTGLGSGYRVVLPCRWGYKWVKWIRQIIVVDYNYKGTYESYGYSDEAIRPNCTMPLTVPQLQTFNATELGNYTVKVLSKSSIESFSYADSQLFFNIAGLEEAGGYFFATFQRELLAAPYSVYVDQTLVDCHQIDYGGETYLYFTYPNSTTTITVQGTRVISPRSLGDVNGDGTVDMLDISIIIDVFLTFPGHPNWNPSADVNNDNIIDMTDVSIAVDHFLQTA